MRSGGSMDGGSLEDLQERRGGVSKLVRRCGDDAVAAEPGRARRGRDGRSERATPMAVDVYA